MVDLENSQDVVRRFFIDQFHQYPDSKANTSHLFHYDFMSSDASKVNPHLFIVDWQIPESEENTVTREYIPA
jgi:hypothetical protein